MQSTYQVPWEKLAQAWAAVKVQYPGKMAFIYGLPVLFLCGLKFQHSYHCAAENGTNPAQGLGAGHFLDDLLDETCRQGLRAMVRIYRSRTLRCAMPPKDRKTIRGLEQFYFETAFSELLERPPFRVQRWIQHGNEEVNLVRFSFGMGVCSIWAYEALSLVRALALGKEPLLFWDHAGKPCFPEIKRIVDGFEWSAEWVLPQI